MSISRDMEVDENMLPSDLNVCLSSSSWMISPVKKKKKHRTPPEAMDSPPPARKTRARLSHKSPTSPDPHINNDLGESSSLDAVLRRKSPRNINKAVDDVLPLGVLIKASSPKVSRRSKVVDDEDADSIKKSDDKTLAVAEKQRRSRRSKKEAEEKCESPAKPVKRGATRGNARHPKRKAAAPDDPDNSKDKGLVEGLPKPPKPSRRAKRVPVEKEVSQKMAWLQYLSDLYMWKDTSKSVFVFGSGTFCILSSFFTNDLPFSSFITIFSYIGLLCLSAVFLYKSFLQRENAVGEGTLVNYQLSEEDFLKLVRFILPFINDVITKGMELFSGDPSTTLKLSILLWLLAQTGHRMTLWTLLRMVFFLLFTIPRLYSCYSCQLQGYGDYLLLKGWELWNSCTHKKTVLGAAVAVVWNMSSYTSRLIGAFILIVALRNYQQTMNLQTYIQADNQNGEAIENTNLEKKMGLELMEVCHE